MKTKHEHFEPKGPKRILALDGGGIRGILTIQLLKRIEEMVKQRTSNENALLCDYFDLIGGTSTGAIIAAALSLGWRVSEIEALYLELGESIFDAKWHRKGLFRAKYSPKKLRAALKKEFRDIALGSDEIKTGLSIICKRLDTGSPWVLHNNPEGRYFESNSKTIANKEYLLRNIVRASSAAPHYFQPELMEISDDQEGAFVDGGVSPHNNPALQLLMLASLKGHGFNWDLGAEKIQIVSLGSGLRELKLDTDDVVDMPAAELALCSLASLMNDASALNETMLQWVSNSPTARTIDREIGELGGDLLGDRALCSYLRYQVWFEQNWLKENLGLDFSEEQLNDLTKMDEPENVGQLIEIGKAAASKLILEDHFSESFNI